ncbi:hypothetical protein D3C80_1261310 [compost metagenome]
MLVDPEFRMLTETLRQAIERFGHIERLVTRQAGQGLHVTGNPIVQTTHIGQLLLPTCVIVACHSPLGGGGQKRSFTRIGTFIVINQCCVAGKLS